MAPTRRSTRQDTKGKGRATTSKPSLTYSTKVLHPFGSGSSQTGYLAAADYRRKPRLRPAQNCLNCRILKTVCNRGRPSCTACSGADMPMTCLYEAEDKRLTNATLSETELFSGLFERYLELLTLLRLNQLQCGMPEDEIKAHEEKWLQRERRVLEAYMGGNPMKDLDALDGSGSEVEAESEKEEELTTEMEWTDEDELAEDSGYVGDDE